MPIYSQETADWFFNTFAGDEIGIIDEVWVQRGTLNVSTGTVEYQEPLSKSLSNGRHESGSYCNSQWEKNGELNSLANSLTTMLFKKDRTLAERCVTFLLQRDLQPLFAHFFLTGLAEFYYAEHEIERTIDYCNMAIAIAVEAAEAFKKEYRHNSLPAHKGYERLCIIYDKKCNHSGAIAVARQAKSQGWAGDWDRRVVRYTARMEGVTAPSRGTLTLSLKTVLVDGKQVESHSNMDESKTPYIAVAKAYGRTHLICRFCHREYPSLNDGTCDSCFVKSFRYRETPRKLTRCLLCKALSPVFESSYYLTCENCYNDRKGGFCAKRDGAPNNNDGGFPCAGCRGCGEDRLVNGFGYCEECYCVGAVHPVRLCTQCGQYGLNNHLKRQSIFAHDHPAEEVWKKDMQMASSQQGGGWHKRYRVVADICKPCWKTNSRARKQKSNLITVVQNLKEKS